jgi:DME family drug/metabolite transporter
MTIPRSLAPLPRRGHLIVIIRPSVAVRYFKITIGDGGVGAVRATSESVAPVLSWGSFFVPTTVSPPVEGIACVGAGSVGDQAARGLTGRTPGRAFAVAAVVLACLCWGTIGAVTSVLPTGTDPLSVAAARMFVGGAVLLAVVARPRAVRELVAGPGVGRWLAVAATAMAGYQFAYFTALADAGVAVGSVVDEGTVPLFVGVLVRLAGGRLSVQWQASTGGAIAGCALLLLHGAGCGERSVLGIGCALVAGASYALFTVGAARVIGVGGCPKTAMALIFGGAGLLMSPQLIAHGSLGRLLSPTCAAVVIYLGIVATAGAYLLYGYALRSVSVAVVSTLLLSEPAFAGVAGATVLGEQLGGLTGLGLGLLGFALVVAAIPEGVMARWLPGGLGRPRGQRSVPPSPDPAPSNTEHRAPAARPIRVGQRSPALRALRARNAAIGRKIAGPVRARRAHRPARGAGRPLRASRRPRS